MAVHPSYAVARWWFLRLLGVVYLIAFVSLWTQIDGLIGRQGILPAQHLLEAARRQLGPERYWLLPTVCWFNASDGVLQGLCAAGSAVSVLLLFDAAPALALGLLWALYLSLATVCQDFLSFQWDNLLLEIGLLAVFLAPLRLRPRPLVDDAPPSPAILWLLRWLLFRLMFSSGIVKLASGDPAWRTLAALTYHYETQPLPTWIGWWAHQLPAAAQRVSCVAMFVIELAVPWLIFGPRRTRDAAACALIVLQALIALTGNYCFFNVLTVMLCLLLLDDAVWPAWAAPRAVSRMGIAQDRRSGRWPGWVIGPVAGAILVLTAVEMSGLVIRRIPWPAPVIQLVRWASPFRSVNGYGLFAVMTTKRSEIIVEGSDDGEHWKAYEFRDKPGGLSRRPRFVAPHQPRLDWQMWFAALGGYQDTRWFLPFCGRLLEGSPAVLALLASTPFPGAPPRYLRAVVYVYHFTDSATRRATGHWWRREERGVYCPVVSLR